MSSDKAGQTAALAGEIAEAVAEWMIKYPVTETMPQVIERILNANPLPRLAMTREQLERVATSCIGQLRGPHVGIKQGLRKVIVDAFLPYISSEPSQPPEPQPAKIGEIKVGDMVRTVSGNAVTVKRVHSPSSVYSCRGESGKWYTLSSLDIAEVLPAEPEQETQEPKPTNGSAENHIPEDSYLIEDLDGERLVKKPAPKDMYVRGDLHARAIKFLHSKADQTPVGMYGLNKLPLALYDMMAFAMIEFCSELLGSERPEPQPELPAEIAETGEGSEVDAEEVGNKWDQSNLPHPWRGLLDISKKSAIEFAQHFQNRGFQMGRAAAQDLADSRLRQRWDDNDEYRSQIESLTAELRAVTEERDRLREGKFTPEELQNLCHNLHGEDFDTFCDGCHVEQQKFFGKSERDKLAGELKAVREERDRLREVNHQYMRSWESHGMDMHPAYLQSFNHQKGRAERAEAELDRLKSQPVTAIAGPPTREVLEAVLAASEDAVCVWGDSVKGLHLAMVGWYLDSDDNRSRMSFAKWHTFITPPAAATEQEGMPVCPECGNHKFVVTGTTGRARWRCDDCGYRGKWYASEAEAIEAARSAGKGEV